MESRKELDCERLELLLIRRHIEKCEACRVELTNLLMSDRQGPPRRRESDKNMSEEEWKRVAALRSEAVRRHSSHVANLDETDSE
jgi:predicted anti-sigma-YlaC factor YlaD